MKLVSWNVNGIRAILKKGFTDYLKDEKPDVIGLQEIKGNQNQIETAYLDKIQELGYTMYFNPAVRPGYSGTAIFTKSQPKEILIGIDTQELHLNKIETDEVIEENHEGRVITQDLGDFYFTTVYTPNSKPDLSRLPYRQIWDHVFLKYMKKLEEKKPVIFCGDLNVAHTEIDLKHPKNNRHSNGFTDEERAGIQAIIDSGFVDTYRHFYPEKEGAYTRWTYMGNARKNNSGWRIDYFLSSPQIQLKEAFIRQEVLGSDHCPVGIIL